MATITNNICNIYIKPNILNDLASYTKSLAVSSVVLIVDEKVYAIYQKVILDSLKSLPNLSVYPFKSSEKNKNLASVNKIYQHCLSHHANRKTLIIGMGGGIVGDIATFVASTFYRGCMLAIVPTTFMACVDSCYGGKGAVNFKQYKNLIGSFYKANFILIDSNFLQSLKLKQLHDGLSEVVKYAFLFDLEFFNELPSLDLSNLKTLNYIIEKSLRYKASLVEKDLHDNGERAKLNFGHTIAHSLEKSSSGKISHGSAVAMGMVLESKLACSMNLSNIETHTKLVDLLKKLKLYKEINKKYIKDIQYNILSDKKIGAKGEITLPYVSKIGFSHLQKIDINAIIREINIL